VRPIARLVTSVFLAMMLGACAATDPLPPWFDAIERLPIRSVTVAGHRIAYLDVGAGPPLILLHGFGGSMWQWEYQQAALSPHVRVITPDLLGSGLSDKPDIEYRPDELLASLTGFMDALQIPQAIVAGHSMGAGVAIGLALDHPDRVSKLILISGLPPRVLENLTNPTIKRALETRAPAWLVSLGNWLFGGLMTERILKDIVYDPTQLTPSVLDRANRNRRRPGVMGPILRVGKTLPLWESRFAPRIGSITQPTLILWGEEDRVLPLAVGQQLHATIPGSIFVAIPRAGHIPQWEQPALVNQHVLRFAEP
jgi:pimeloyl-ACP methyl ester carboxylesterase